MTADHTPAPAPVPDPVAVEETAQRLARAFHAVEHDGRSVFWPDGCPTCCRAREVAVELLTVGVAVLQPEPGPETVVARLADARDRARILLDELGGAA